MLIKGKRISEDLNLVTTDSRDIMYDTDSDDDSEIGDEHRAEQQDESPVRKILNFLMLSILEITSN